MIALTAVLGLVACPGPTFIVQQYPGAQRASDTIAVLRVNGGDSVRLVSLDEEDVSAPVVSDGRLHIEMLPARHTVTVVDVSAKSERAPPLAFDAEAGKVYRVAFVRPDHSAHVFEVDRGNDAIVRDVTLPASEPLPRPGSYRLPKIGPASAGDPSSALPGAAPDASTPAVGEGYPVGRECRTPEALAREKRPLPPLPDWKTISSAKQRVRVRVPAGVFQPSDATDGFHLVSSQKAATLGPGGKERAFAIHIRRLNVGVDELLADRSKNAPLANVYVEGAFPRRTASSFVAHQDEPMGAGSAVRTTIGGKPTFVWINGVEGYDSDYVLVELGAKDTAFVVADWNSAVMVDQPECWQRTIIGGVVESLIADEAPRD